jgi:hypothetical protein
MSPPNYHLLGPPAVYPSVSMASPVILFTQESEIGRIKVQSQPGEIVCEILS